MVILILELLLNSQCTFIVLTCYFISAEQVQKLGSVGRSIDVMHFNNYHELRLAISCMFALEGQLDDPWSSEWKLVYVDYENDVLLVGDDPWEYAPFDLAN